MVLFENSVLLASLVLIKSGPKLDVVELPGGSS